MLLGFQGEPDQMTEAFATIEVVANDATVSEATKLQARMVYHTNSGSLDDAVIAARQLVGEHTSREDISDLFRAFCNAAVTCRVAGLFDEASDLFSRALAVAKKHSLPAAEQRVIPLMANMALEVGNVDLARELFQQLCELPLDPTNRFAFLERQALAERLALCEGRVRDAREFVPMTYDEAASDPIYHRRTYNLALYVVAEISASGTVAAEAVNRLEESFLRSRAGVHQAFGAFVLYAALKKVGQPRRALSLLNEYRTKYRREPWPAPDHLLQTIMQNCGVT
jgi:tetratricopeptide (TPR) repeat protein